MQNHHAVPFVKRAIPIMLAGLLSTTGGAQAQTSALEEITVTAQKRRENAQDVPISISVLNSSELEKHNVVSMYDLNGMVPGVVLAPYPGSAENSMPQFRGVPPLELTLGNPMSGVMHLNGVALPTTAGFNAASADLERVEVLKGPQGVLAGRNATAGVINLYTAKPIIGEFGFKQLFTVAERGQFVSKTSLNFPLADKLAARVTYAYNQKDSDGITNSAPGGPKFGEKKADAWRLDLRWVPTDKLTVDYGYDRSEAKSYDTPPQCRYAGDGLIYGDPTGATTAFLATMDPRIKAYLAGCSTQRLTSLYYPFNLARNINIAEGHLLNVEWVASPTFTLRSITGYRKVDTANNYNYGATAGSVSVRGDSGPILVPGTTIFTGQDHPTVIYTEAWSQEFQFLGELSKNLKYTSGIYFSRDKGHQTQGPNAGIYIPDGGFALGGTDMIIPMNYAIMVKNTSAALFGQLNWFPDFLGGKLEIVPGIRFTRDHRQATGSNTGFTTGYVVNPTGPSSATLAGPGMIPLGPVGFTNAVGDRTWSVSTPALSFNYHWDKDLMSYIKFAKGYTSGGFDVAQQSGAIFSKGYEPQTVKTVEFGLKGEFMDRRLRANIALFQSKYSNEQQSVAQIGGGWAVANVGGSTYKGLEFDTQAKVTQNLRLGLNYAHLDHKFDRWVEPGLGDVTGLRSLVVPKSEYSLNLDYRFPFALPGKLDGNLSLYHRDEQSSPLNLSIVNVDKFSVTPAYSVWNGRLSLSEIKVAPGDSGRLAIALWGRNLANKAYTIFINQSYSADSAGTWAEPRTFGVDLTYKY